MAQDQGAGQSSGPTQATSPDRTDEGGGVAGGLERPVAGLVGRLRRLRGPIVAIAAVGAVLSGLVGYWNAYRTVRDVVPPSLQPTHVPPAYSVAVMPFTAATGDPKEQQFASALTENVLALMGKSKLLRIASARAAQEYKGKPDDPRSIGRALNVRYLVDGAVRIIEGKATITLQLTDCESATQMWSHRLTTSDLASREDHLAAATEVTNVLRDALNEREERRALAHPILEARWISIYRGRRPLERVLRARRRSIWPCANSMTTRCVSIPISCRHCSVWPHFWMTS